MTRRDRGRVACTPPSDTPNAKRQVAERQLGWERARQPGDSVRKTVYVGHFPLADEMFDGTRAETIIEKIREVGAANIRVHFDIEAEDLWEMRDFLSDLETELRALGVDWSPERKDVQE